MALFGSNGSNRLETPLNTTSNDKKSLSYRDAGVDIDAGNELVERIKPAVKKTMRPEVLTGLGGFGALFRIDPQRWREPLLVSPFPAPPPFLPSGARLGRPAADPASRQRQIAGRPASCLKRSRTASYRTTKKPRISPMLAKTLV